MSVPSLNVQMTMWVAIGPLLLSNGVRGENATSTIVEVKRYHQMMVTRDELFRPWTVGQVAERSGLSVSALHFYEREGLIFSNRNDGNQRRFGRDTLRRLAFIRAVQSVGLSLADIGEALDRLPRQRTPREKDWTRLAVGWRDQLDARIEQLERLRDDLTTCIGCGCLSFERCKLVNAADRLAAEGAGARRFAVGTPRPTIDDRD